MNKTGRNDPCPCGSGKKYKKCHLAEDENTASVDRKAATIVKSPLVDDFDPDDDDDELFDLDQEADEIELELDALLHDMSSHEMLELLTAYVPKAELIDVSLAKGFFERVWDAAESLAERDAYRVQLNRLGHENPEIFAEIGGQLLWDMLKQTLKDERLATIESLFITYAAFASGDLVFFLNVADCLAYYGLLEILVKGMRAGWPTVRESKLISKSGLERFKRRGIHYEVYTALEASDPIDEPELSVRIRNFEAWEDWEVKKCIEHMSIYSFEPIPKENFSVSRGDMLLKPDLEAAFQNGLNTLTHLFRGFLRIEKAVPWTQADLAAAEFLDILNAHLEESLQEARDEDDAPIFWNDTLVQYLCPDSYALDAYFGGKLFNFEMQEFRACSVWANLSHWLEFLVRVKLVDQAVTQNIWASWKSVLKEFECEFGEAAIPLLVIQSAPRA